MKICNDCCFHMPSWGDKRFCTHPRFQELVRTAGVDIVTGETWGDVYDYPQCRAQRADKEKCGPDGVLFEAKQPAENNTSDGFISGDPSIYRPVSLRRRVLNFFKL